MYQCIGLATETDGGCGEDWWHPECLLGLGRDWYEDAKQSAELCRVLSDAKDEPGEKYDVLRIGRYEADSDHFVPRTFPKEDQIEALICYKCCNTAPWIKQYAGSPGFLPLVRKQDLTSGESLVAITHFTTETNAQISPMATNEDSLNPSRKRAVEDLSDIDPDTRKKAKTDSTTCARLTTSALDVCFKPQTDSHLSGDVSLIASDESFRARFCRCSECYQLIRHYPQLLEEEDNYEPSLSEDDENEGGGSAGTKSLMDRGEAALSNVDRVRAIGKSTIYTPYKPPNRLY